MSRTRYFDTISGIEIEESAALNRHGILIDGCTMRVSMRMRDAALSDHVSCRARITDGTDNPFALNKPGFRVRAGDTRQKVADAYADYEDTLVNAYRRGGEERDRSDNFGNASTNRESLQRQAADSRMEQDHQSRMKKLYADRDRELSDMWRQP